jgi:hypothetical protein
LYLRIRCPVLELPELGVLQGGVVRFHEGDDQAFGPVEETQLQEIGLEKAAYAVGEDLPGAAALTALVFIERASRLNRWIFRA